MSAGSPLVVDASVVIKWHVEEVHSAAARELLDDGGPEMHAPELLLPEVGNILWKKIRRAEVAGRVSGALNARHRDPFPQRPDMIGQPCCHRRRPTS